MGSHGAELETRDRLVEKGFVSRETLARIDRYVKLLNQWQVRTNLVAPSTLDEVWSRHVLDSAQLLSLQPDARSWIDLGSGGGFPGLVIACAMAEKGGIVNLVESNLKKAAFLRHVSVELGLPAHIHAARIESTLPRLPQPDVVTARALAPLGHLLEISRSLLKRGAVGLFPKGRDHESELTEARKHWHFSVQIHPSLTDKQAAILEIRNVDECGGQDKAG